MGINSVPGQFVSSVVYGEAEKAKIVINNSSVMKSLTMEDVELNIDPSSFKQGNIISQTYFHTTYVGVYNGVEDVTIREFSC